MNKAVLIGPVCNGLTKAAIFSWPVRKYRELLLSLWHWCGHGRWLHTLKFYVRVFYIMSKALSGERSCTGTILDVSFMYSLLKKDQPSSSGLI